MDDLRSRVLDLFHDEGFPLARVAGASLLEEARTAALDAFDEGRLATMAWMSPGWLTRATDPTEFLPGARSVILCALPAHSDPATDSPTAEARGTVARYARGRDYHRVFEKKIRRIARRLRTEFHAQARATVDYGPLLERPLAARAGLGWLGKSTMLLVPGFGPWVLLGAVATSLELEPDMPLRKSCGSCTRCIAACPTGAISPEGGILDSRLCISYHTIENRGPIPRDLRPKFGGWVFGCDDCLDSCPVGLATFEAHPDLVPKSEDDAHPLLADLLTLDEPAFRARFQGRAIMRAGRAGLARNACVALGNVGTAADAPTLVAALDDEAPLVRGHAAWALGRLRHRLQLDAGIPAALERQIATEHDPYVREELALALAEARS